MGWVISKGDGHFGATPQECNVHRWAQLNFAAQLLERFQ